MHGSRLEEGEVICSMVLSGLRGVDGVGLWMGDAFRDWQDVGMLC